MRKLWGFLKSHSPLPWRITSWNGQHDEAGANISDAQGRHILSSWGGMRERSPQEEWDRYHADPEFAIHAANCFDDLVRAVSEINDHWYRGNFSRQPVLWDMLEVALEKANGYRPHPEDRR